MPTQDIVYKYERDELYTYSEAAVIVGVRYDSIATASRTGVLTKTSFSHGYANNKFVLKSEVDAIAGLKAVTSKEARARIDAVRRQHSIDNTLKAYPGNTRMQEELSSGEPFTPSNIQSPSPGKHGSVEEVIVQQVKSILEQNIIIANRLIDFLMGVPR